MPNYVCKKCGKPIQLPEQPRTLLEGKDDSPRTRRIVVICPHCGTRNGFEVKA